MSNPVICIGAALVDELYHASNPILLATTNEGTVHRSAGGVSRNIAHQLALLGVPVQLISVFGSDGEGDWLKTICEYRQKFQMFPRHFVHNSDCRCTNILEKYPIFLPRARAMCT